jgi:hypothetical protein
MATVIIIIDSHRRMSCLPALTLQRPVSQQAAQQRA